MFLLGSSVNNQFRAPLLTPPFFLWAMLKSQNVLTLLLLIRVVIHRALMEDNIQQSNVGFLLGNT